MPYSYNNQYPINVLPHRIRLSDGSTRTDSSTFTVDELTDAGYVEVSAAPEYNDRTHKLSWDGSDWQLTELTTSQINSMISSEWNTVREERDDRINDIEWKLMRYHSEVRLGVTTTSDTITNLDNYVQGLRDITKHENWPNLEDSDWPTPPS